MAHRFVETNIAHLARNDRKRTLVIVDTLAAIPGVEAGDFRLPIRRQSAAGIDGGLDDRGPNG